MTIWKPLTKDSSEVAKKEPYEFFLVRPRGFHPASGKLFSPSVVQLIDGKLYTCDNELDPIIWSHKDDQWTPTTDPCEANLEWCEIPE